MCEPYEAKGEIISNFFLCDHCDNNAIDVWLDTCNCRAKGMEHVAKKVMLDYHGVGGKRYDEPKDVCKDYVERRGEACTERT